MTLIGLRTPDVPIPSVPILGTPPSREYPKDCDRARQQLKRRCPAKPTVEGPFAITRRMSRGAHAEARYETRYETGASPSGPSQHWRVRKN